MNTVSKKRLFVLSLDGTPFSFLQRAVRSGLMPHLGALVEQADFRQMDSVLPPVSSSAWASFLTGKSPAQHGVMGFVNRDPVTLKWYVPRGDAISGKTILQELSGRGKRVFSMNVPMTCPPEAVNGILIAGFLADDLSTATYPPEIGTLLKARGYQIDVDTELAKQNLIEYAKAINRTLEKRVETMWHFWRQESWDFFMTHIMETDRLYHFFWQYYEEKHPVYASLFEEFHRKIDRLIGDIVRMIPDDTALMLLSDHGFTTLREEVNLNRWFYDQGLLRFVRIPPQSLQDLHRETKVYSLYPGRIFINLKGRESSGSVMPGAEYEEIRAFLRQTLHQIKNRHGQAVIKEVFNIEDLADTRASQVLPDRPSCVDTHLPDLLAVAHDGFDLKGRLWDEKLFEKNIFNGTHTFHDAFVLAKGVFLPDRRIAINDLFEVITGFMDAS